MQALTVSPCAANGQSAQQPAQQQHCTGSSGGLSNPQVNSRQEPHEVTLNSEIFPRSPSELKRKIKKFLNLVSQSDHGPTVCVCLCLCMCFVGVVVFTSVCLCAIVCFLVWVCVTSIHMSTHTHHHTPVALPCFIFFLFLRYPYQSGSFSLIDVGSGFSLPK